MKRSFVKLGAVGLILALPLTGGSATDAEIKERVVHSTQVFDNPSLARRTLLSAIDLCEGDTNRFERVLWSLVEESLTNGNARIARIAMRKIGRFGTTNSLPFLYGCATNVVAGGEAMQAAVKIGGITSNAVDRLGQFISLEEVKMADRAMCCHYLLKLPSVENASQADKLNLAVCLMDFAPRTHYCTDDIDAAIVAFDPTYRYSRRRLAVARSQSTLMLNEYGTNYVNSVINELVAYPESALGD